MFEVAGNMLKTGLDAKVAKELSIVDSSASIATNILYIFV
jgi:hypothetical protein